MSSASYKYAYPVEYAPEHRRWPERKILKSPMLCAVDLRDGNQALPAPLEPKKKLEYFNILTKLGFKQIEIGFPAASLDEWMFCRQLIEGKHIPDDITVSVLTQARPHIIQRTMEALHGVSKAICHLYIPASDMHLKYVLGKSREEALQCTVESVRQIKEMASAMNGSTILLEFSPEEFTDANLDFIVQLCDSVVREWNPRKDEKVIINLPSTVERALPNHYPDMIEAFCEKSQERQRMTISLHAHNDMGGALASTELALMAGGERVEGTLFGNGERCGNLDIVTLALNLQYLGVETGLDFSQIMETMKRVTAITGMPVPLRQPYAGALVFTAFSGSHQDAISKGLAKHKLLARDYGGWKMPYLHINPQMIGRTYEDCIRINSQSGKGGLEYVLLEYYGIRLPEQLLQELERYVQEKTDKTGRELRHEEIWTIFLDNFCVQNLPLHLINYWPRPDKNDPHKIHSEVHIDFRGERLVINATGDGPVAAFANALRKMEIAPFKLVDYEERSMGVTVNAEAITIVTLENSSHQVFYGIGFGANIDQGAVRAIVSGLNRIMLAEHNR